MIQLLKTGLGITDSQSIVFIRKKFEIDLFMTMY